MTRKGRLYRKWLAGLLAAAFVMTSAPQAAFAEEPAGDVPEIEAAETIEASDEAVFEEGSGEDSVTDEEVSAGNAISASGRTYTDAIPAETEKKITATLHPHEEYETNKWDRSRFYVYTIKNSGYYNFKANCDADMSYVLGHDDDKYSSTGQRTYMTVTTGNADKDDVFLHDGRYYLKLYTTSDEDTVEASFTLSFKEEVYRSSEESPEEIRLDQEVKHQLNNLTHKEDDDKVYDRHFFALTLPSAGVATVDFTDDYNSDSEHTYMVITHAENTSEAKFEETIKTNDFENFKSTAFRWIDKDTVRLSLPRKGTYNIKIYCTEIEKRPTYTFSFKDFTPLQAEKNEELFEDKKLGGSNDWADPLDNDWGEYYSEDRNGPMPEIKIGQKYRSILTSDSRVDYFKFTLAKEGPLFITAEAPDIGQLEFAMTKYDPKLGDGMYSSITVKPDPFTAYANKPFNKQQLQISLDKTGVWKFYNDFPAGEYTIYVHADRGNHEDKVLNKYGCTGIYSLMLSTSKSSDDSKTSAKPVTRLTLDNSVLTMNPGEEKTLTAMVTPLTADDTGVKFEVTKGSEFITLSENIVKEDDTKKKVAKSTVTITADKKGEAEIQVTTVGKDKKDKSLVATCTVSVIEGKPDCPAVATKQKVDLSGEKYFGQTFDKNDVLEVDNKAYGSVTNKGIFTARKAGTVTVIWKRKDGKNKIARGSVSFRIETPEYIRKDRNNKPVKTFNLYKNKATVSPDEVISTNSVSPSGYLCSDTRRTNFDFDENTGIVTAKKSGSCKITVLYGDNEKKLATKAYTYTVKATLPTIKSEVSVKNNQKPVVVKLTKVQADVQKAGKIEWRLEGVSGNGLEPDGIPVRSSYITYEPVTTTKETTNLMSCKITSTSEAKVGDAAFLIVKVDGIDYWCKVTIKQ